MPRNPKPAVGLAVGFCLLASLPATASAACDGTENVSAKVVALDQVLVYNRLGAYNPAGMIFALARDVFPKGTTPDNETLAQSCANAVCTNGNVQLRSTKRPRPLTLRVNEGDTLCVEFTNLLSPGAITSAGNQPAGVGLPAIQSEQPFTRTAGLHIQGMKSGIGSDASKVGQNPSSLVAPGGQATYTYLAEKEGAYVITSGPNQGGEGGSGAIASGLFGVLNVEPTSAEWYRSQVSRADMDLATPPESFDDLNGNGILDPVAEQFTDANGNGAFDAGEVFVDANGNGVWDAAEAFTDTNRDGIWNAHRTTPDGHPILDYDAVYPPDHPFAGSPILNLVQAGEIVHNEVNAIITGPERGGFIGEAENPVYPNRGQPFREHTMAFHDEVKMVQAFPAWFSGLQFTLGSVKDGFAVNYATGGVGAEIIANRLGVGPMHECVECKYEEFFLTSWAVGDPGMVVDVPATTGLEACNPALANCTDVGPKATKAFYPADPATVFHGYLNDRTKIRNIHVGTEHHIFHLHAHQWHFAPDDPGSNYLDAQAIGPGSSFTYEIAFGGAGNRAKSPGDAIFHCHFYPHFAQGMWGLWRVHDVFETGTLMDTGGLPAAGARALPDGEIAAGTPIPGVVPIPGRAMAPMPEVDVAIADGQAVISGTGDPTTVPATPPTPISEATGNPGFPFFIPGVSGHRPPTPPLDLVADGGLPRHVITAGTANATQTATDFDKVLLTATGHQIPENGTPAERAAMDFHGKLEDGANPDGYTRSRPSYLPDGNAGEFQVNGLAAVAGAPFAEPCRADAWVNGVSIPWLEAPIGNPRYYAASVIELPVQLNKVGWHFDQSRIIVLDEDAAATLDGTRAPEPFVMRANTMDCVDFDHTNLVPNVYQLDDFQVRTPTDVVGQHIHLVKFDVMAADGAANGWNYEDGTLSPDEVAERIHALTAVGGAWTGDDALGEAGPRTTRQRWFLDPGWRGNVFTHDHYGPSTHQQAGLYATLLVEPEGSQWTDPVTGEAFGTRVSDGGPTSWRADIDCTGCSGVDENLAGDAWREFYLEFADFQLAYRGQDDGGDVLNAAGTPVNPSDRKVVGLPHILEPLCVAGGGPNGCRPEAISAADPGTFVVNYRNEPLALRVRDPLTNSQALTPLDLDGDLIPDTTPLAGDLSYAFSSDVLRADVRLNTPPEQWPYNAPGAIQTQNLGALTGDPFTPTLQVYEGDKVQLRVQVGATEEGHNMSINGVRWLQQWNSGYSGFRNSQMAGISEYFIFQVPSFAASKNPVGFEDYLYQTGSSVDARWNGSWGIMRAYDGDFGTGHLIPLPNNPDGKAPPVGRKGGKPAFAGVCPREAPERKYDVVAVRAADVLPGGTLAYHPELDDPTALLYVLASDLDANGMLKPERRVEPLILRAAAGECVFITLTNQLPAVLHGPDPAFPLETQDLAGFNLLPMIVNRFNANQLAPSSHVGLHAQLVEFDMVDSDGMNVGFNPVQTAAPGETITYKWYAGKVDVDTATGELTGTPVEYGAINLMPADPIKGSNKGLIGALVVEPEGSFWADGRTITTGSRRNRVTVQTPDGEPDADGLLSRAALSICTSGTFPCEPGKPSFRDFVLVYQDDVNMRFTNGAAFNTPCAPGQVAPCGITVAAGDPVPTVSEEEEPEDSGMKGLNYRTDPLWLRLGIGPTAASGVTRQVDFTDAFANLGGLDPVTPVFTAAPEEEVRFRVLKPGGHNRNQVFTLHGHLWPRHPYNLDSTVIDPDNVRTFWHGEQMGHGPSNHANIVPLGGAGPIAGDYLYRDMVPVHVYNGEWGIFRVE